MIITERTIARIAIIFAPIVAAAITLATDSSAAETTTAPTTAGMQCATAKRTVIDPTTGAIRTITRTVCVAR